MARWPTPPRAADLEAAEPHGPFHVILDAVGGSALAGAEPLDDRRQHVRRRRIPGFAQTSEWRAPSTSVAAPPVSPAVCATFGKE
jgi:hypothetical protein